MQQDTRAAAARPTIVAYISGHGFGHFTRSAAVLERVASRARIVVRTSAQALLLSRRAAWASQVTETDVGPGAVQRGPLAVDVAGTRAALQQHLDRWDEAVAAEARFLHDSGAWLVFADVPPIAFAAAARAGVPSVGMSNFSWSWIYEGYAATDAWFAGAAARLRQAEAQAGRFLGLDMGGGLEVFPRLERIAPIVRRPLEGRAEVRARLGLHGERRPVVLCTFGGFGAALDLRKALARNPRFRFLVVSGPRDLALENAGSVEPSEPDGLGHPELVAAADCVLGKPGYGTAAECLYRPTPFVYVPRGDFREQPALVAAMRRFVPSACLSPEDLYAGRLGDAIDEALAAVAPEPRPEGDGIAQAADRVLALAGAL